MPEQEQTCDLCGEPLTADFGEYWVPRKAETVIADALCAEDAGMILA